MRLVDRISDLLSLRRLTQIGITGLLAIAGVQYYLWVSHFRHGTMYVPRPESVEAFLPISALVALKAWVTTGVFTTIHPAAVIILLAVLVTAIFFHRGFCGWVCPVGLIEEIAGDTGIRLFGRKITPHWLIDYPLRGVKFLILGFFLKVIIIDMPGEAALSFLHSPYNKVAAVKMLDFWLHPGTFTIAMVGGLFIASLIVQNVWCRYVCPYGALLSIIGWLSPATVDVRRDTTDCVHCGACTATCPNYVDLEETERVRSLECTRCTQCIESCQENALKLQWGQFDPSPRTIGLGILVILFGAIGLAMITGHWESALGYNDWAQLVPNADEVLHSPY